MKCYSDEIENERKVSIEQGRQFASQYGMKFIETSAKKDSNVVEGFLIMTKDIIKIKDKKNIKKKNIEINNNVENIKNNCC